MFVKESYTVNHYVFNTGHKEHITFNVGRNEDLLHWDFSVLSLDRVSMRSLIEQAKKPGGLSFSKDITFKINHLEPTTATKYTSCDNYEAAFYHGNQPFLITLGCYWDTDRKIWNQALSLGERYQVFTPLPQKIANTFIVDIFVPKADDDIMFFMYNNDCRKFTRDFGLSLLTPESARF